MNSKWEKRRFADEKCRNNDKRKEYEKDYARLIHSASFRRLQSKTQIVGVGENDVYRTRLTHSIEVAQIGVGILRHILRNDDKYKLKDLIGCEHIPSRRLIESICLAHDIGHPPFGHGGEVALNLCMQNYGGFEGNAQTVHILSKIDKHTDGYGINPTRRMLLGVLKYPVSFSSTMTGNSSNPSDNLSIPKWAFKVDDHKPPKCFYDIDQDVVNFALDLFSSDDQRRFTELEQTGKNYNKSKFKSFDTSIMDLADEISYSVHDLEDGIALKMITKEEWLNHFFGKDALFLSCHSNSFPYKTAEEIAENLFSNYQKRKKGIGDLCFLFITNCDIKSDAYFKDPLLKYNVFLPEPVEKLRSHIFDIVNAKFIKDPVLQQIEFKGQKIILELFEILKRDPQRFLPSNTTELWKKADGEEAKLRVICNFVAGMTDSYATRMYQRFFAPEKGSIFDML